MANPSIATGSQYKPPEKISKLHILLVEGQDEVNFFDGFLKNHLGIDSVQVIEYQGKVKFVENLPVIIRIRGFSAVVSVGVVRDSDSDSSGALNSVIGSLRHNRLPIPKFPNRFVDGPPRVGVMLLPGKGRTGALEDLCLDAVKQTPAYRCVESYIDCLEANGIAWPNPNNAAKARIHAFLASKDEPELRLGQAALRGYLQFDSPVFDDVKTFLLNLTAT